MNFTELMYEKPKNKTKQNKTKQKTKQNNTKKKKKTEQKHGPPHRTWTNYVF